MYYNPVLRVNINMHTLHLCHAGARVGPRGSVWLCHVALRATSHPRESCTINTPFFALFLINLNDFKIKINSDKFQKIPINCKNHNFHNTTPN